MKLKKTIALALVAIVLLSILSGCTSEVSQDQNGAAEEGPAKPSQSITLSTGSSGGMFYILGSGIATVLDRRMENVSVIPVTPASINEVPFRINSGENLLGMGLICLSHMAVNGLYEYEGKATPNINRIAYLFDIGMSALTVEGTGIREFSDIVGKNVGISSVLNTRMFGGLLEAAGIDPNKDINWVFMSYAEQAEALKDGTIDVGFIATWPKSSLVEELSVARKIVYLYPSKDILDAYAKAHPYWKPIETPAGTYPNQEGPTYGPGFYSTLDVHSKADEELVYEITKTLYENVDDLIEIHPAAEGITPKSTIAAVEDERISHDSLHPGALRYYKEIGVLD